jgi:SpoVK/Ycf46/Vps4 family AAA+-type ATPase
MVTIERTLMTVVSCPVFATAQEGDAHGTSRSVITVPIARPTAISRRAMWQAALLDAPDNVISECAERYAVTPGLIAQSARSAIATVGDATTLTTNDVHVALRTHLDRSLSGLARRIATKQDWSDLVLPPEQFDLLIELVARVKHRSHVLENWGFAEKVGRGLGLAALLSGPPGTGKTMIAGLIARELGLDLYQVDLSKIVSKFIGETEKQLAQVFDAAESGHAILLFDEADSLFGKRTEVKGSNDRYANLEVNYLLQRVEAFSGITLLTTNHETAIDQAFLRRLAFHVRVPMPEEEQREMLWRSMLPSRAACEADVDFAGLASEFVMSGGYVKNAVLRAAFLAADAGTSISNECMWRAASAEYEAMGKVAVSR